MSVILALWARWKDPGEICWVFKPSQNVELWVQQKILSQKMRRKVIEESVELWPPHTCTKIHKASVIVHIFILAPLPDGLCSQQINNHNLDLVADWGRQGLGSQ